MNKKRILVVDADFDIRNLLNIYLRTLGYEVVLVESALAALMMVDHQPIDLVIIEETIPSTGVSVQQFMRQLETIQPQLPYVRLVTQPTQRSGESGIEFGRDDFITKPFDLEEIRIRVRNQLGG